jgi:sugar lactone lactonase YvrE
VNGAPAFIHGTNFNALNVPLAAGSNLVAATVETLSGLTNTAAINLVALTNGDGSLNDPVQLQATPVAGFSPLPVGFQIQTHLPGTLQQVAYDFNGDGLADFITNNLDSITHTYPTNGEYYPVVTLQTTAGSFSSVGGWNAVAADADSPPVQINVQLPPTVSAFANIADPVDLKWDGANLYVLSRSAATLTEFDAAGNALRSVTNLGLNPSGFDVDTGGNVYVAVTGSNQVWKLYPTDTSFVPDGGFGYAGMIGTAGAGDGEFNAPFDVAVSPDGGTIAVSDAGNHRLQWIDSSGNFMNALGSHGAASGQFDTPKGLVYDAVGTLYVVDSGNHRLVTVAGGAVQGITGTNGTALGQFNGAINMSIGARGVYVADTGNNRVQAFDAPEHGTFSITPGGIRYAVSTNFSQPYAVAAVNNATNDQFYVADTGNNRVILCTAPNTDADALQAVWQHMTARVAAADIPGAVADFSVATAEPYRQAFLSVGMNDLIATISQIGTLTPVSINGDHAEYQFTDTIGGETVTFPVEFSKENGVWKILEF